MKIIDDIKKYIALKKKAECLREEITEEAYHYIDFRTKNEQKMHGKGKNFTKRSQRILLNMMAKEDMLEDTEAEIALMRNWRAKKVVENAESSDVFLLEKYSKKNNIYPIIDDGSDVFVPTKNESRSFPMDVNKNDIFLPDNESDNLSNNEIDEIYGDNDYDIYEDMDGNPILSSEDLRNIRQHKPVEIPVEHVYLEK
ncbi:MAG: hypothetical protein E7361_03625 [Clostridiales bacterium]|nr:hypothetical protein [Clostridiales bacterium]